MKGRPAPAPRPAAVTVAWVGVAVVMVLFGGDYRLSVAVGAGVLAVAAVGVDLSVGTAGMLVFSAPAFMLVGALASAMVPLRTDLSPTAATLAGMGAGLGAGFVLAVVLGLALRRVSGIGVALVTLFFLHLVRGVVHQREALGGTLGLSGVPPYEVAGFRAATPQAQAVLVMVFLAVALGVVTRYVRSGPGRELRAVHGDARAAAACGVAADRRRLEAFVLGSLCATLAGSLYAHTLGYVSADALGLAVLMDLLLIVFLGGAGSIWGAPVGALFVRMAPELWAGPDRFDVLARGAAFLIVLTVAPGGLAGAARGLAARRPGARAARARRLEGAGGPAAAAPVAAAVGATGGGALMEATGVARSFGGVQALDGVDLSVAEGELCAVIGANGAGKTTLFNVLTGTVRPERGVVRLRGVDLAGLGPHERARLGIARTFQEVRLFPGLTVLEHAMIGTRAANHEGVAAALAGRAPGGGPGRDAALDAARRALTVTGLSEMADVPADELPFGWQRRVELARAVAGRPAVLLLDEPASGLSQDERHDLVEVIRRAAAGAAVLVVDHDGEFVFALAPRVVALDGGRVVFDGPAADASDDAAVVAAYRPGRGTAGR